MRDVRLLRAFFESLRSDGVRIGVEDESRMRTLFATRHDWDLPTVRVALRSLLVHDPHQRASFDRYFEAFFSAKDCPVEFSAEELQSVLDDLRNVRPELSDEKGPPSRPVDQTSPNKPTDESVPPGVRRRWIERWRRVPWPARIAGVGTAVLLCAMVAWLIFAPPPPPILEPIEPGVVDPDLVVVDSRPDWTPDPWWHLAASDRLTIEPGRLEPDRRWLAWLAAAVTFLAAGGGYAGWLLYWQRLRLPPLPTPQPDAEGCGFSIAAIGGPRAPLVSAKRARRLADMLGQTASDEATRRLDLPRTVERTSRAGGFPQFAWQADRITRRVLILEDARIDPACLSGAIDDLQRGLERTGVEVQRAWFREGIGRFADDRGGVRELRELAAWRQQYIVLVHTDGSGFHYQAEFDSLDALAEWPRVAVLDPRSDERRDRATDPLTDVRLARFARFDADEAGIARAFRSFVDRSRKPVVPSAAVGRQRVRAAGIADPEREVAAALGDSLMWAADCVWLQPCSRALAEALRQRFHPELPADRLQRIMDLPGTRSDADGLRFGIAVRSALRTIWQRRRSEGERREVLDFIQQQIDDAQPAERNSTAHLAWEAVRERFVAVLLSQGKLDRLVFKNCLDGIGG